MSGRDFEKDRRRQNMARRGSEAIDGGLPVHGARPRKKVSKIDQRKMVCDLFSHGVEITRIFRCNPCRHQFYAQQPETPTEPMTCPKCGRPT